MRTMIALGALLGCLSFSSYSQENITEQCVEKILDLLNTPQSKFEKLPQEAKDKILAITEDITNLTFPKIDQTYILDKVQDAKLKKGFKKALDAMEDFFYITDYFAKLEGDVLVEMLESGKDDLVQLAQNGELDHDTIVKVLSDRMKARNIELVTVETTLSSQAFKEKLRQGAIIDRGFSATSDHGIYSHLVQQDMTYDLIASEVGGDYKVVMDFLGSEESADVWGKMYDSFASNLTHPEWFKKTILRPFLNLTLNFEKILKPIV